MPSGTSTRFAHDTMFGVDRTSIRRRSQDPEDLLEHRVRVRYVLDHLARDDAVEHTVAKGRPRVTSDSTYVQPAG